MTDHVDPSQSPHVLDHLSRAAAWVKWDKRSEAWIRTDPTTRIADLILSRSDGWPFPPLVGFVEAPTILPDGRLILKPGYDEDSGLFLIDHGLDIGPIESPTRSDAAEAWETLFEIIKTFPFLQAVVTRADGREETTSAYDEAAAIAAMMTAVYRRALPSAPIFLISAHTPGTGKSLLARVISTIATGRPPSMMGLGGDNAETEKRLGTMLIDGDPIVCIDNVDRAVKSDLLCRVATEIAEDVRVLGYSRKVTALTNVCFLMTGNNITVLGDLARRVVPIRMDAGVEQPETRPIPRDGVAHALKQRPAAIRAMLTITRAYLTAGSPDVGVAPYGSFETWDALVRRPLVWAMRRDPLETARAVRADDHEFGAVADLCAAWLEKYGSEPVSAAQIVADAKASYPRMDGGYDQTNPALAAVVGAVLGDLSRNGARELEYRLRAWHGRIVCGRRILKAGQGNESRAVLWKVV